MLQSGSIDHPERAYGFRWTPRSYADTHQSMNEYIHFLRRCDVDFAVADDLVRRDDFVGPLGRDAESVSIFRSGTREVVEARNVAGAVAADHATMDVLAALEREARVAPFSSLWEIGCGTGLLAIWAAHQGVRVIATDVSSSALELARINAARADVEIEFRDGSVLEPFGPAERADMIVANLPHKPAAPHDVLPVSQHGGAGGRAHHRPLFMGAASHLNPAGRVLAFLHSLPAPELLKAYGERYDLTLMSWKVRWFGETEYLPMRSAWRTRADKGESYLVRDGEREGVMGCVWKATRR